MNFTVQQRESTGKGYNRKLRRKGLTPGIIYGKNEPLKVSMKSDATLRYIKSLKGAKKVLSIDVESPEGKSSKTVLVQDYQMATIGNKLVHVDFLEVNENSIVSAEVPIILANEEACPAVKKAGGVIQVIRRAIPVRCKVKDIPQSIEIDLIDLEFGDSIHVLDITYPDGVEPVVFGRNFTLVTVAGRAAEEIDELEEGEEGEEVEGEEVEGEGEAPPETEAESAE